MRYHIFKLFHIVLLLLATAPTLWASIEVDARLSHHSFPFGKAAMLTITVTGSQKAQEIKLPEIENLQFHQRGQSSQFNSINGQVSRSMTYNYLIEPLKAGDYTIAPIQVTVGSADYTTKAISFTATAPGTSSSESSSNRNQLEKLAFLRISAPGRHYPGERVPITIKAYFNTKIRTDLKSLPTFAGEGIVMPRLSNTPAQSQETVDGENYHVLSWDSTITGVKIGQHPLEFTMDTTLLLPQSGRSRSPFSGFGGSSLFDDSFFDSVFGNYRQTPLQLKSQKETLEIVTLPEEGKPEDFSGAIGQFTMQVAAHPPEVEIGEPITLKVTISGEGNFDRVDMPGFTVNSRWKTYPASSNFIEKGNDSTGNKVFEQAIVAKEASITEIPPLSFSYFDPQEHKYITNSSLPIPITIKGKAPRSLPAQPITPSPEQEEATSAKTESSSVLFLPDLAPLKLETGSFTRVIKPLFLRTWYISLFACAMILLIGLRIYREIVIKKRRNPQFDLQRQRKALLGKDMKELEKRLIENDCRSFLAGCRTAIQNQLGMLWQLQAAAISSADIAARFSEDSFLVEIFQVAERAAYAGAELSTEQMHQYSQRLKKELEELP